MCLFSIPSFCNCTYIKVKVARYSLLNYFILFFFGFWFTSFICCRSAILFLFSPRSQKVHLWFLLEHVMQLFFWLTFFGTLALEPFRLVVIWARYYLNILLTDLLKYYLCVTHGNSPFLQYSLFPCAFTFISLLFAGKKTWSLKQIQVWRVQHTHLYWCCQ